MEEFERLLRTHYRPLERFVKYRLDGTGDADDVLQEVCMQAYERFHTLRDRKKFKPWIIQIAQNRCRDYYRRRRPGPDIPLEAVESSLAAGGSSPMEEVRETLETLSGQDRLILELSYFEEMNQAEIAQRLGLPVGTVKSRLYHAKRRFRAQYPYGEKGEPPMKQLPAQMPQYTITPSAQPPFSVKWEELMGWFIVPKVGKRLQWAMYEFPERKRTTRCEMEVIGKAQIHGIQGVEIRVLEHDPVPSEQIGAQNPVERTLVAQLTDTHSRILSECHTHHGVKELYTFLDGDDFLGNWGFGPDNCGNPVQLTRRGIYRQTSEGLSMAEQDWPLDILGRYTVTIGGTDYDTVCVMDVSCYDTGVASETYLDQNGRTVLWRRFNRDDWAFHHFQQRWTEKLPDNERLTINGQTYVHWYDIITDYIR